MSECACVNISGGQETHLTFTAQGPVKNLELKSACPKTTSITLSNVQKQWREDEITADEEVNQVYSMKFKKPLKRIIFVNGQPYDWAAMGITQNKRTDDPTAPGYLDWSNYSLAIEPGDGKVSGKIIFEYFS